MKIILTTVDNKEVTLSTREEDIEADPKTLDRTQHNQHAVMTIGDTEIELDPAELVRAVEAMWGEKSVIEAW